MSNWDCSVEASVGAIVQALLEYQGAEKQSLNAETIFAGGLSDQARGPGCCFWGQNHPEICREPHDLLNFLE
jgi:hypothetical protein